MWAGDYGVIKFAVDPDAHERYHQEEAVRMLGELALTVPA